MHRKKTNCSPPAKVCQPHNSLRIGPHHQPSQEVEIKLIVTHQQPALSMTVPKGCNMKILKSILYYNLKNQLPSTQFNRIVGFESIPTDYQTDYKLHLGIGEVTQSLNLLCLSQQLRGQSDSLLNYKICKLISVGGFSKVYLLRDLRSGEFRAGKFISKQNANLDLVHNEYLIASHLNHPHIIQTHHFIETEHFYFIIMEYLPGGELFDLLKAHRHMPQEYAKFYLVETLLALQYLHNQSIIYRDIKPENIIIDHEGHIKLTDFGLAKMAKNRSYSFCGSLDYMAPEIIQQVGYSYEIDYYSIGNLLFEILLGSPPFYHPKYTQEQTKHHIMYSEVTFSQSMQLSTAAMDLLSKLLQKKPENRLGHVGGIDQILEHEWFQGIDLEAYNSKLVEPPFKAQIRMEINSQEGTEEERQWKMLIELDLKKQRIRQEFTLQKQKRYNFNNRRSCDEVERYQRSGQKRSQSKLKSNLSLMYVMTQKRSSSVCPPKKLFKSNYSKPELKAAGMFKSLNLSRKSSLVGFPQNKQTSSTKFKRQSSQPDLNQNFILVFNKKNKENGQQIRKKGRHSKTMLKFTR